MKPSTDFDPQSLRPECITSPGTNGGFQPRPMPRLPVACPVGAGGAQRYREPLWRPFKAGP